MSKILRGIISRLFDLDLISHFSLHTLIFIKIPFVPDHVRILILSCYDQFVILFMFSSPQYDSYKFTITIYLHGNIEIITMAIDLNRLFLINLYIIIYSCKVIWVYTHSRIIHYIHAKLFEYTHSRTIHFHNFWPQIYKRQMRKRKNINKFQFINSISYSHLTNMLMQHYLLKDAQDKLDTITSAVTNAHKPKEIKVQ